MLMTTRMWKRRLTYSWRVRRSESDEDPDEVEELRVYSDME